MRRVAGMGIEMLQRPEQRWILRALCAIHDLDRHANPLIENERRVHPFGANLGDDPPSVSSMRIESKRSVPPMRKGRELDGVQHAPRHFVAVARGTGQARIGTPPYS